MAGETAEAASRLRGQLTQALGRSIRDGGGAIGNISGLLQRVLEQRAWEERIVIETGEHLDAFPSFAAYVIADAPLGLGTTLDQFKQLIEHDVEALDLYQEALKRPAFRPVSALGQRTNYAQPHHMSIAGILRRLKKDRPDLHAQMLAGEITANAAGIEAGYIHPRIKVPTDDMERLATTLRKNLDAAQVRELVERLKEEK
jgi:hypothetical protein